MINISAQYNGGLLPDIILLTQGYYHWGTRLNTTTSGFVFIAYVIVYYYYHVCVMVYYIWYVVNVFWCPCMAINV